MEKFTRRTERQASISAYRKMQPYLREIVNNRTEAITTPLLQRALRFADIRGGLHLSLPELLFASRHEAGILQADQFHSMFAQAVQELIDVRTMQHRSAFARSIRKP